MKHTNKIKHYLETGLDGKDWYNNTKGILLEKYGSNTDLFCDILAATSLNTTVQANMTLAKKAYAQLMHGDEFTGYLPAVIQALNRVVYNHQNGTDLSIAGRKVNNFAAALKGNPDAIVVDRWMLRAFGFPGVTDKRYNIITDWCLRYAGKYDIQGREVQAAIWCGIKRLEGDSRHPEVPFEHYL